jgi:hypothetical protein
MPGSKEGFQSTGATVPFKDSRLSPPSTLRWLIVNSFIFEKLGLYSRVIASVGYHERAREVKKRERSYDLLRSSFLLDNVPASELGECHPTDRSGIINPWAHVS